MNDREPGPTQPCALAPAWLVASGLGQVCPWRFPRIPTSLSKPWERVFSDIKPENILGYRIRLNLLRIGCRRVSAGTSCSSRNRVQGAINPLFSAGATFRNIRQCRLESQCNKCKKGQRFYFLQRQRCAIFRDTWQCRFAAKCDQRQSSEGWVRDSVMREWNIKVWDSLGFPIRFYFHFIRHLGRDAFSRT